MILRPAPTRLILLLLTLAIPAILCPPAAGAERPRIGLALSGGGARGAAHVGVLRLLEQLRIPIDSIAGTSMGAVVGGLYAMGMSPDEIQEAIEEIDWNAIFKDEPPREERRIRRKLDDQTFLLKTKPGVVERERKVNLVPALIQGQTLELTLRKYTLPASKIRDFDRLPIPFRAVASDVVTGEPVILGSGDLALAIRASMAVPAVFAPVELGDSLLVDGGLAMNLPVSVVRDMGADVVIAVDVGGPRRGREDINDVLQMLDQIASLVTWRNTQEQIARLSGRDVLLIPPLEKRVLSSDFNKMLEAVAIGEAGAQAKRRELAALALPAAQYAAYRQRHQPLPYRAPTIDRVQIENLSSLSDALILERLDVEPGAPLDPDALERQLSRVYDQDTFESVRYRLEDDPGGDTVLVVSAKEKGWGTSSLQGGLELSSTTGGDSHFNIGLAYTMAPLNSRNGEWRTLLQAGEEPHIFTEVYQPIDALERWYLGVGAGYLTENLVLFEPETFRRPVAEYQLKRAGGLVELGRNFGDWGRLSLGYSRYVGNAALRIGAPRLSDFDFDAGEIDLRLYVDTLDSLNFPRRGWFGDAFALASRRALGASRDYDQAGFSLLHARSRGKDGLIAGLTLAGSFGGDTPPQSLYRLGGFMNLSGFNQLELSGRHLGLARGIYLRDLGTGLVKTFAGGSLEAGNVWNKRSEIDFDSLRVAGSLFLGADTFLGPLYLGYGHADGGHSALYLFLGRPWRSRLGNLAILY